MVRVVRWAQVLFRPIFAFPISRSASGDGFVVCWTIFFRRASLHVIEGGIAQLVERLVRNELLLITLTFPHLLLSALS